MLATSCRSRGRSACSWVHAARSRSAHLCRCAGVFSKTFGASRRRPWGGCIRSRRWRAVCRDFRSFTYFLTPRFLFASRFLRFVTRSGHRRPPRSRSQRSAQFASFNRSLPSFAAFPVSGSTRLTTRWTWGWVLSLWATIRAWCRSSSQRLERLLGRPVHLGPVRPLVLRPAQRVVDDRLLQLPPRGRHSRQALELGGRVRRRGHLPRRPLRTARKVPGLGPLDPLVGLRPTALESRPGHRGGSTPRRRRTSAPARGPWRPSAQPLPGEQVGHQVGHPLDGLQVPAGTWTAPECSARATWLRFAPMRCSSIRSAAASRCTADAADGHDQALPVSVD